MRSSSVYSISYCATEALDLLIDKVHSLSKSREVDHEVDQDKFDALLTTITADGEAATPTLQAEQEAQLAQLKAANDEAFRSLEWRCAKIESRIDATSGLIITELNANRAKSNKLVFTLAQLPALERFISFHCREPQYSRIAKVVRALESQSTVFHKKWEAVLYQLKADRTKAFSVFNHERNMALSTFDTDSRTGLDTFDSDGTDGKSMLSQVEAQATSRLDAIIVEYNRSSLDNATRVNDDLRSVPTKDNSIGWAQDASSNARTKISIQEKQPLYCHKQSRATSPIG